MNSKTFFIGSLVLRTDGWKRKACPLRNKKTPETKNKETNKKLPTTSPDQIYKICM